MALRQDWNSLIEDAQKAGVLSFYANGYVDMIPRIRAIAENLVVPAKARTPMIQVLENHQSYLSIRKHIEDYLDKTDRHMDVRTSLWREAEDQEIDVTEVPDYPGWRQEAGRLTAAGEAILSDKKTYGPHLDNITIGESRVTWALSNISRAIGGDDEAIGEKAAEVQKPPVPPETPEERALRAQKDAQEFSRLQSAAYNATGEARKAAQKAFDDYLEREAHKYETPREERRHAFDTDPAILSGSNDIPEDSQQAQEQPASPETPEERARQAQEDAREFSRLQSAAYNATGEARKAAQKAFDDYLEREAASSAGFSRPHTTQRGKRARRRRRPSTIISNARPISTKRPGKKSARPVRSPGGLECAYSSRAVDYVRALWSTVEEKGRLFEAVRGAWKVSLTIGKRAEYGLAIINGIFKGVFAPDGWHDTFEPDRYGFEGQKASGKFSKVYLGKRIKDHMRKKGMAAPVLYEGY